MQDVLDQVLEKILRDKFRRHADLRKRLQETMGKEKNVGGPRGSIFRLSRGSQLPYNKESQKHVFLDFPVFTVYLTPDIPPWRLICYIYYQTSQSYRPLAGIIAYHIHM